MEQGKSIYKKELKLLPKYDYRAGDYSIKEWFLKAKKFYLENYVRIRSWSIIKRFTLIKEIKILDYRRVYIYKFNKYGRFIKYKARLIVRGDQ